MIRDVVAAMNAMREAGVVDAYAIGGAVAATVYLEPVATLDVDVFVALAAAQNKLLLDPQPIFDYLRGEGYAMEGEHILIADWPVQILATGDPLIEEAMMRAAQIDIDGVTATVFTAEHAAAIALATGRAKDKGRLLQFLEAGALDVAGFEDIIRRHGLVEKWESFKAGFL